MVAIPNDLAKHWRLAAIASALFLVAAMGTYISGQYRIGRLDSLMNKYEMPVTDFAAANAKARQGTVEADLLEECKQAQIGSWLQTTDALKFKDPVTGNRIVVSLEPGRDFIDINGREISSCISDEVENRQYDIGSMTNSWAVGLLILGLLAAGAAFAGYQRSRHEDIFSIK